MLENVLGMATAFVAIFSALMVVLHRNPIVNIVFLIVNLACIAVFFLMLGGQFIAAIQVIVYAGAIMVLFVFVIMLLNLRRDDTAATGGRFQRFLYLPVALLLAGGLMYALLHHRLPPPGSTVTGRAADFGTVEAIGRLLFTDYLFAFEAASILLVVAMIGAVVLAKRRLD